MLFLQCCKNSWLPRLKSRSGTGAKMPSLLLSRLHTRPLPAFRHFPPLGTTDSLEEVVRVLGNKRATAACAAAVAKGEI